MSDVGDQGLMRRVGVGLVLPETYAQFAVVAFLAAVLAGEIVTPFELLRDQLGLAVVTWLAEAGVPLAGLLWGLVVLLLLGVVLVGGSHLVAGLFVLLWLQPWNPGASLLVRYSANRWWELGNQPVPPVSASALATMVAVVLGAAALLGLRGLRSEATDQLASGADFRDVYRTSLAHTAAVLVLALVAAVAVLSAGVIS